MPEILKLMVCKVYNNEAREVFRLHGWKDVELHLFPQVCQQPHLRDQFIKFFKDYHQNPRDNMVVMAGCFPELEMHSAAFEHNCLRCFDQCFNMVTSGSMIDWLMQQNSYILTPGWLEEWRRHLEQWGLDQSTAHDFFHEGIRQLALLDTGLNPSSLTQMEEFGNYLDLPTQILPVGLDYFDLFLSREVSEWKLKQARKQVEAAQAATNRENADSAMAFDLITRLTHSLSEDETIEEIVSFFTMMFSPGTLVYARAVNGEWRVRSSLNTGGGETEDLLAWARQQTGNYAWSPAEKGFFLRLIHQDETVGALFLSDFKLSQYKHQYFSLSIYMAQVCSMAIYNARINQKLLETEKLTIEQKDKLSALLTRVQANAADLEEALNDQKAFSYSISHDLRGPLRVIGSYSTVLQLEYADTLPPEAKQLLERIHTNIARMNRLIDDLLTLSKIGYKTLDKESIDLNKIMAIVLDDFQDEILQRKIEVITHDIPPCRGDPSLLRQILENLISNAIKFTRKRKKALIEIGYQSLDHIVPPLENMPPYELKGVYFVKDNGAGFDMVYQEKLFGIFQRLHNRDDYEGNGVGLAIVQRAVVRHGGMVWARGQLGQGATFYISLP